MCLWPPCSTLYYAPPRSWTDMFRSYPALGPGPHACSMPELVATVHGPCSWGLAPVTLVRDMYLSLTYPSFSSPDWGPVKGGSMFFSFCVKMLFWLIHSLPACVCVFCMKTAHQVATFLLPVHMESPIWMGVGDGNMIVFESGPYLFLFTISGHLLQRFEDHQRTISNLWVVCMSLFCPCSLLWLWLWAIHPGYPLKDSVHILTTSMDDSLHLYMWEDEGRYPYLKSCCHLEHIGSDLAPSW